MNEAELIVEFPPPEIFRWRNFLSCSRRDNG
jgi:hypothetical protein